MPTRLTDLSASRISAAINWEAGEQAEASLGDVLVDGTPSEYARFDSIAQAVAWLRTKAVQRYPNTDFARKYKQG